MRYSVFVRKQRSGAPQPRVTSGKRRGQFTFKPHADTLVTEDDDLHINEFAMRRETDLRVANDPDLDITPSYHSESTKPKEEPLTPTEARAQALDARREYRRIHTRLKRSQEWDGRGDKRERRYWDETNEAKWVAIDAARDWAQTLPDKRKFARLKRAIDAHDAAGDYRELPYGDERRAEAFQRHLNWSSAILKFTYDAGRRTHPSRWHRISYAMFESSI